MVAWWESQQGGERNRWSRHLFRVREPIDDRWSGRGEVVGDSKVLVWQLGMVDYLKLGKNGSGLVWRGTV